MPTYRYRKVDNDLDKIKNVVTAEEAELISATNIYSTLFWDISAPASAKARIDEYLTSFGWEFVEEDPSSTQAKAAASSINRELAFQDLASAPYLETDYDKGKPTAMRFFDELNEDGTFGALRKQIEWSYSGNVETSRVVTHYDGQGGVVGDPETYKWKVEKTGKNKETRRRFKV